MVWLPLDGVKLPRIVSRSTTNKLLMRTDRERRLSAKRGEVVYLGEVITTDTSIRTGAGSRYDTGRTPRSTQLLCG